MPSAMCSAPALNSSHRLRPVCASPSETGSVDWPWLSSPSSNGGWPAKPPAQSLRRKTWTLCVRTSWMTASYSSVGVRASTPAGACRSITAWSSADASWPTTSSLGRMARHAASPLRAPTCAIR